LDKAGIVAVAEDLHYLSTWGPNIPDAEIRRGSAVLRRLLVEDAYGQAWRASGRKKQPRVVAIDIEPFLKAASFKDLDMLLAAGADFRGIQAALAAGYRLDHTPQVPLPDPLSAAGYPGEREYMLSEYVSSPSGYVAGAGVFTRRDVIKYIANVRDGVHASSEKPRREEEALVARIGEMDKRVNFMMSDGMLFELVAIAQAIGRSADAKDFALSILNSPS
jgi:hypothetical protein